MPKHNTSYDKIYEILVKNQADLPVKEIQALAATVSFVHRAAKQLKNVKSEPMATVWCEALTEMAELILNVPGISLASLEEGEEQALPDYRRASRTRSVTPVEPVVERPVLDPRAAVPQSAEPVAVPAAFQQYADDLEAAGFGWI